MTAAERKKILSFSPVKIDDTRYVLRTWGGPPGPRSLRGVEDSEERWLGYYCRDSRLIALHAGQHYEDAMDSLLHEILHVLLHLRLRTVWLDYVEKIDLSETKEILEEELCTSLAPGLLAVFMNNPELARELVRVFAGPEGKRRKKR